jgi:ubiquinone/menaquinone biosynthesis C-methylase UbiE
MTTRRPGLQRKWLYVVNSLENIIPSYERGSSRISLFRDRSMRAEAIAFAVHPGDLVLDLGSGPGTMSRMVAAAGGTPVLLDVSRRMLVAADFQDKIRASFEYLPLRSAALLSIVSGFAIRDSRDLYSSLEEVSRVLAPRGRFAFCDLGKPSDKPRAALLAVYLRIFPPLIGLISGGLAGLRFGSLFSTYMLTLDNDALVRLLRRFFVHVSLKSAQMGGSIVVKCGPGA